MKRAFIIWLSILPWCAAASSELSSPDGKLKLNFELGTIASERGCPIYQVSYGGVEIIKGARLGLDTDAGLLSHSFDIISDKKSTVDETWKPVYGERSSIRNHYNQLEVVLKSKQSAYGLIVEFRCFNEGAAFRYRVTGGDSEKGLVIKRELTEFSFLDDHTVWTTSYAQGVYGKTKVSRVKKSQERPLVLQINEELYVAVAEARMVDYARMMLRGGGQKKYCLGTDLEGSVKVKTPYATPWRVVMAALSPGALVENNDIILNLNDPCAIADTSWINPGKVIREVTLTTQGAKMLVDFAVKNNLQYIEFDAGWYGYEYDKKSDARTVTVDPRRSAGPLDLQEVIRYGNERGIGTILYVNHHALERQLDELLPLYQQWGVAGLKYGFVNVGSQTWTKWLHEAVRKAAQYKMMVDVHDNYRPTGYSRTYPNLLTQEGIRGDESKPSASSTLTTVFTRMIAGAGDHTVCYFDPRVAKHWSHGFQLAKAVCLYSPWQFLYWYDGFVESSFKKADEADDSRIISDEPEMEFFKNLPTVWDDTKVLQGSIGEYAVMARRSGAAWFVGGMNANKERVVEIPLGFLKQGVNYTAKIYTDDATLSTRTKVKIEQVSVDRTTVLHYSIKANNGIAIHLFPTQE